jgi:hypothetical protein
MKKSIFFLLIVFSCRFVSLGQDGSTIRCNLSVTIDSIVVKPCFIMGGGGSCGCGNTLWAVVTGGTPPYSYLWTPSSVTTDTLHGACYLEFSCTVTDSKGCVMTDSINVVMPTLGGAGIAEYGNQSGINLFPVPAANELTVSISDPALKAHTAEIYDMLGKKVAEQKINANAILLTLDVSSLQEGNYLLRVVGVNGQRTSRFTKDQ